MWKIVIIDDDKNVLQGMRQVIPWEELGAEWVGEAPNGEEGLSLIREAQPDIVITDIYMPVMGGLDMVEKLGEEDFCGKIVILSGYSDFEYARQALRLGIADYLNKPITVNTIREVLQNLIKMLEEELGQKHRSEELEQRLQLYEPYIQQEWVKSTATGSAQTLLHDSRILPQAYQHWLNRDHRVIGIEIIPTERLSTVSTKDLSLFRFAITNIIQEVCKEERLDFEYVELFSNHLAIILNFEQGEGSDGVEQQLILLGRKMIHSVNTYLKISIQIGIGTLKHDWTYIADSTEEAFQAINTKNGVLIQGMHIYSYNGEGNTNHSSTPILLRPVKFYQQITEAVKTFQEEKAIEISKDYCKQLMEEGEASTRNFELLGQELWMLFTYALFEVNVQLEAIVLEAEVKQELREIVTIVQFESWLHHKIQRICAFRLNADIENVKHKRAVDFIVTYIHDHYEEQLTISELADRIFISRNYISHLFKKSMGESFNNYLTRVRMEKAKEMILEGKYLIYEIAERVGYKNVPYFSSQFKKFTGKNPTDLYKNPIL